MNNRLTKGFSPSFFFYLIFFCIGQVNYLQADITKKEIVNPHWTGKNCIECHISEHPESGSAKLKYDGDPIKLCNNCHGTEFAREDIHPIQVAPLDNMKKFFPTDWPLKDGKLSCLTCHDLLLQMNDNFAVKTINPKFLRGGPYASLTDFCFICHQEGEYNKTNPHKQLNASGEIIENSCRFCHQSLPNPEKVENIKGVSFKSSLDHYCIICHPKQKTSHPARADHIIKLPENIKDSIKSGLSSLEVYLPLDNDNIFCGTCHNPHQKGVIKREKAQYGSGEKFFLRLNGGYELCVACHIDKRFNQPSDEPVKNAAPSISAKMILSDHKPEKEKRCKACHVITPENRGNPAAIFLCFKDGCHKTDIVEKKFSHEKSVLENCYLCHTAHSSIYRKLLKYDGQKLCRTCHPQIKYKSEEASVTTEENRITQPSHKNDTTESAITGNKDNETLYKIMTTKSAKEHTVFTEYFKKISVSKGNECGFCHSPYHKEEITRLDMEVCSDCHNFVRGIMASASSVPINIHDSFITKDCTQCHDPHSSKNKHLLKLDQDVERYIKYKPEPAE
jgi:predicted CXXCH cytochrome family protein